MTNCGGKIDIGRFTDDCPKKPAEETKGCRGFKSMTDLGYEYDCGYNTSLDCEECKYGGCGGNKDPEAKDNQL